VGTGAAADQSRGQEGLEGGSGHLARETLTADSGAVQRKMGGGRTNGTAAAELVLFHRWDERKANDPPSTWESCRGGSSPSGPEPSECALSRYGLCLVNIGA
jgi:hypothetical protein